MGNKRKNEWLVDRIDTHLRKTSRQLVTFDTVEETLNCLLESFWEQFSCDFVSIVLKKRDVLEVKAEKGHSIKFRNHFPMEWHACSPRFLMEPVCCYDSIEDDPCTFFLNLTNEGFSTWFTVPIKESDSPSYGVCVIAYRQVVPLILDAQSLFEEFGKDIATAIGMAIRKENEKKKISGLEWLKDNLYLGSSIEELIHNIVERAGKDTNAESAHVYLYDDVHNCLVYHAPSYGPMLSPAVIKIDDNNLRNYFPYLEKEGGDEMTVPLQVNLKTIGVLHISQKSHSPFDADNLEYLQFVSSHVSVLIENARLYKTELEDKYRLEKLMVHNQKLVKKTLVAEGFQEITQSLSQMMGRTVILFDRFFRPISFTFTERDLAEGEKLFKELERDKWRLLNDHSRVQWVQLPDQAEFGIWKVFGGGDLLGYLGLKAGKEEADMVLQMTVNHALNVYAIQFIKQKLVLDVKEQVKDGFINQLFVEKIEDKNKMMEYANLFNLNIMESNKVGLLAIEFDEQVHKQTDLFGREAKKTWIWERIREHVSHYNSKIVVTRKDGFYILIAPAIKDKHSDWEYIYTRIKKLVSAECPGISLFLGISQSAEKMEDYYTCYRQALQTLNIVSQRFRSKGFLDYDSLGSYAVLHQLQDSFAAQLFINNYLDPLLQYGGGKGKDLFDTLRVYLQKNGNLKDTAEHMYIHRSSLKYRLEKIRELLQLDIDDAEERFNLMLAFKLFDLYLP